MTMNGKGLTFRGNQRVNCVPNNVYCVSYVLLLLSNVFVFNTCFAGRKKTDTLLLPVESPVLFTSTGLSSVIRSANQRVPAISHQSHSNRLSFFFFLFCFFVQI
ncbi:hypothetical protein AB205_0119910 [Aquarana catesbeiana]|uniref:Uncharacterized protein n=1 Tax=Aquarana catesbeiana TaxID=8400 RepID=A0A2G9SE34_AQUCT|nr:hypothetical protein AB205_0119910 [Aquarana catesbeiana]